MHTTYQLIIDQLTTYEPAIFDTSIPCDWYEDLAHMSDDELLEELEA